MSEPNINEIEEYAYKLLELARDTIIVRYRFFDVALSRIKLVSKPGLNGFSCDGDTLCYDALYLIRRYADEDNIAVRLYMHILFHCIFSHQFNTDKLDRDYWNLASDIAVENIIFELDFAAASLPKDSEEEKILDILRRDIPKLTADRIYKYFMVQGLSDEARKSYADIFRIDSHDSWINDDKKDEIIITKQEWEKIARRIKTDLKTFSKHKNTSEALEDNIDDTLKIRYNYREILEHFMVMGEELELSDEEFDYIYYTYGLNKYGNMPLIEPLEYKEDKRIKEFVIVLDTSASCQGEMIKKFVRRTYDILKDTENFFKEVNIHIIQCDASVRSDTVIRNDEDFEKFIQTGRLTGHGNTDFRPAFSYVDKLIEKHCFDNLKGLIYFTDGYGAFPEKAPDYDVLFAFLYEDKLRPKVPGWAMQVVMEDELNEY
ncbi:MAG: hypothetical protein IJ053_00240 [Lachnospiraceae bacterium]|nr:hypothetical protein [Lachnospiraceae bacterium]